MKTIKDITYKDGISKACRGDLHLPDSPDGAPSVLMIHGGGWQALSKERFSTASDHLAGLGYAVFNINYRLIGEATWPACGGDCLDAARFLLEAGAPEMKQLDTKRITVMGASAGGHLALYTGLKLKPKQVTCIISVAGPSDLGERSRKKTGNLFIDPFWKKFFGKEEVPEKLITESSPVNFVTKKSPPLLCIHSIKDELVPIVQSQRIVDAYRKVKGDVELFTFEGSGEQHGIWADEADSPMWIDIIADKLETYLLEKHK